LAVPVDERLVEINNSVATLRSRMDDMEKHLKELEATGEFEELQGEVQAAINSVVPNVD